MSLNTIKLTPQLLTDLYANVLIESKATNIPKTPEIFFLGSNQKHILIVVFNADQMYLQDTELTFLTNILAACNLSIADVAIINKQQLPTVNYIDIIKQLQSKHILLFGVDPLSFGLPINFPHFQIQQFDNCIYVYAPPLQEVEQEKNLKTKLWTNLKTLFSL